MPLHATVTMWCWEAPSSPFPMKELAVVKADKCLYLKLKGLVQLGLFEAIAWHEHPVRFPQPHASGLLDLAEVCFDT